MGFAAAMTAHRACSVVTMPAFEMEMLCCSMACEQQPGVPIRAASFQATHDTIADGMEQQVQDEQRCVRAH